MHASLNEHTSDYHLYIFAFDSFTYDILLKLRLDNVTVIPLSEFETPELLDIKQTRTKAEYCWTCTPSTIWHVLNKYNVENCTYIDSDLIFYSDPSVLIDELGLNKKTVLITEHRFAFLPRLYEEKRAGRFCVQFVTFLREERSLRVLDKWRHQCNEWCYARYEDGKFGDQKYLDEWPYKHDNVHIMKHQGGGVAPWNQTRYKLWKEDGHINGQVIRYGEPFKLVFYHFQYVRFLKDGSFDIGWYLISSLVKKLLYIPYLLEIKKIDTSLKLLDPEYDIHYSDFKSDSIKDKLKKNIKKVFEYNIISI